MATTGVEGHFAYFRATSRAARQDGRTVDAEDGTEEAAGPCPEEASLSAKQLLDQKLAITDQQIDSLVYKPYGLMEDEIRVIEGAARG